mgnify:CR=1 FL=1
MNQGSIPFTKMEGAGNDFVVLDLRTLDWNEQDVSEWAPRLCNRRYGIGADGVLALDHSNEAHYTMVYKNADGSDAGMCGNGGRCIARYAHSLDFPNEHRFQVHDQVYRAEVGETGVLLHFPVKARVTYLGDDIGAYQVDPGTEHIVLPAEKQELGDHEKLREKGRELRYHDRFQPIGTNVNFMHGESDSSISIQTYERGVENVTLACGTGALASALTWHHLQNKRGGTHKFSVKAEGGELHVELTYNHETDTYTDLKLGGPAHFVFEGTYFS